MTRHHATLARAGVGVGAAVLMVAAVIAITGGFVIDASPFSRSAHRLLPPLVIAAAGYPLALRQENTSIVRQMPRSPSSFTAMPRRSRSCSPQ